jgi:myo-inositol-1(or 4)-monophosphatase
MKKTALKAVSRAARILKRHFGRIPAKAVNKKGTNDFVSFVDLASEKAVIAAIREDFPDHAVLSEEKGGAAAAGEYRWLVDPLDGTTNYLRSHPRFSVSLAVEKKGVLVFGLTLDVMRDELFWAERGRGAFCGRTRMRVSRENVLKEALVLFGSPFRDPERIRRFSMLFAKVQHAVSDHRREGSAALDFAYVACGRAEAFYEEGLKPWDMAAGHLMVQEAGGWAGDFKGDNDSIYRKSVLATNQRLKKRFLALFNRMV